MISLAGKATLVTGGSRGIGAATVKLFAQAGADVVFSYHQNREAALQRQTAESLEQVKRRVAEGLEQQKSAGGNADPK